MINFLPQQERKAVRREYALRLSVVISIFLGFLLLSASALLLPSFVLSRVNERIAKGGFDYAAAKTHAAERTAIMSELSLMRGLSAILSESAKATSTPSRLVAKVLSNAAPGIKVTDIEYSAGKGHVSLRGIARDREALLRFKNRTEEDPLFEEVVMPLSSFAKGSDIDFVAEVRFKK